MMLAPFLARRLGETGRKSRLMLRVATLCVAVSVSVMLVSLGVVNGFRSRVSEQVAGFATDIQLLPLGGANSYEGIPVAYDSLLVARITQTDGVAHLQRFASKAGIIRNDSTVYGIVLHGFAPETDTTFLHRQLVAGYIPTYTDTARNREAVISRSISRAMQLRLGDTFDLLFVGENNTPRRDRLHVAGIYDSGMEEFDRLTVIGDLRTVQRLNGWSHDEVGGYEVLLERGADRKEMALRLAENLQPTDILDGWGEIAVENDNDAGSGNLEVWTVEERYPQIFDWLAMLGLNTTIVIVIMLVVSVVNMSSGVLILVLEQTRQIGILKALGMRNSLLQRIFMWRSVHITLRGLLWGDLLGITLCLIQQYTGVVSLDPQSYLMSTVPVELPWSEVLWLNLGTLGVITLSMALPAAIVARITPDQSIRFQ